MKLYVQKITSLLKFSKIAVFIFLFTAISTPLFSQVQNNTSFANEMNTLFSELEKNRVPYGILLDFGMEFTNVPAFNGTITDSTYVDATRLKQIYNTLLSSRIRNVSSGFVTPQQFEQNWQTARNSEHIVLSGVHFKYGKFADDALSNNKLTYSNGKFYDRYTNGVWQNPYEIKDVFAIASPVKVHKGLNVKVQLPSNLFYTNHFNLTKSQPNIQIDLNDGQGFRSLPMGQTNQVVEANYTTAGVKTWTFKLQLVDGTILQSYTKIKVESVVPTLAYDHNPKSAGNRYTTTITANTPYEGAYGSAKITIDLANNGIQKPLIIAEGFDVGTLLNPENVGGEYSYEDFRSSVFEGGNELRSLVWSNSDKEYDIIYIDWDNGVDYMQRNAYVLQAVIEYVNSQKANNPLAEQNVVLGQSMGGVIARYTLAHMEQNNVDHDTRLFISHDAPQQGANVPVAFQFLYRHLTNQYITTSQTLFGGAITIPIIENNFNASTYLSILDTPASRQLLANFSTLNYSIDNNVHDDFFNELKSKGLPGSGGYPINTRNIAISNGSECGSTQDFNAGDLLLDFQYNRGLSFLQDLLSMVVLPLGGTIGGLFVDNDFFGVGLVGLIPGNSRFELDFWSKAIPYGNNNQIYKGRVTYKKKILWIGPTITINITNVNKNQPNGVLPFDFYGGGFFSTANVTGNTSIGDLFVRDKFNFIPTASALDIGRKNVPLNDFDYKNSYVGATPPNAPKDSPFDNFSTDFNTFNQNAHNKEHISFDTRNGKWLAEELSEGSPNANCAFACGSVTISGSSALCTSAIFSVPEGADSVFWSVSPSNSGVTITSGQGTNQITLTLTTGYSGNITITANLFSVKCGNSSTSITLWSGKPSLPNPIYGPSTVQTGALVNYQSGGSVGATSYEWWLPYPYETVTNFDYFGQNWQKLAGASSSSSIQVFSGYAGNNGYVQVMGKNECGLGGARILSVSHSSSGGGNMPIAPPGDEGENKFLAYPNPSNTILNIDIIDSSSSSLIVTSVSGKLYDIMGLEKSQVLFSNNKATLNLNGLNKGIYVLKIFYNDKVESHQIAVN